MSTLLGPHFDRSFSGRPAHMSPEDRQIWDRWWPQIRGQVSAVYFDVRLGSGRSAPPGDPENFRRMWTLLSQKRADVVVQTPTEIWIVEIRFQASPNAIGRLLTYKLLWDEDPALPGPLRLLLVTNFRDEDVAKAADLVGITYLVS